MPSLAAACAFLLAAAAAAEAGPASPAEPLRISLDFKDADILDALRLMAEVGGFQVVVDPSVACKLTLKLTGVPVATALEVMLRSCALAKEEENGIVRIAPAARLLSEAAERRRLSDERQLAGTPQTVRYRLSYARAQDIAPLLKQYLSPRGQVSFDARTNTLYVTDVR